MCDWVNFDCLSSYGEYFRIFFFKEEDVEDLNIVWGLILKLLIFWFISVFFWVDGVLRSRIDKRSEVVDIGVGWFMVIGVIYWN